MNENVTYLRRIKSFVKRDGRITEGQRDALQQLWPHVGLELNAGMQDFEQIFSRAAPTILEIGFGSGFSLLNVAAAQPQHNFIGIETYQPGIGSLLQGIQLQKLQNIRVFYADAVEVLNQCIPDQSLAGVQIFFPDPWQKRKHHKRRLIQDEFVQLIVRKLAANGLFHLATDWEDYALQMMQVLTQNDSLKNVFGAGNYAERSQQRPIITKFEQRGKNVGRHIWELQFVSVAAPS